MRDSGDALLLHHGRGTEQRTRRHKKNVAQITCAQAIKNIAAQHRRAAAASGAAGVDILLLIKDHYAAVAVAGTEIDALLTQQIIQ